MRDIRVERDHRATSARKRLLLPAALGLLALTALWATHDDNGNRSALGDHRVPDASVAYQGQVWLPAGAPVLLPDRRMSKIGRTREGTELYMIGDTTAEGGGGGGGGVSPRLPLPPDQVYLRVSDDQYQPLNLTRVPAH